MRASVRTGICWGVLCGTLVACGRLEVSRTEKAAWAALQSAEYADRGRRDHGPVLQRRAGGYAVVGIPGLGRPHVGATHPPPSGRSWLLLNEHSPTRAVRQINSYPAYDLSCGYVEGLPQMVSDVDDYVIAHLRTLCH
jgi:hypothetical protein